MPEPLSAETLECFRKSAKEYGCEYFSPAEVLRLLDEIDRLKAELEKAARKEEALFEDFGLLRTKRDGFKAECESLKQQLSAAQQAGEVLKGNPA